MSSAGANRTTDVPPAASAASTNATDPPPGEGGPPATDVIAGGSARTTRKGEAVPRNDDSGPAHRQAAHSARSTMAEGGPIPLDAARSIGCTPGSDVTSSSTTQAPTRRPCNGMRTRLPKVTTSPSESGTL